MVRVRGSTRGRRVEAVAAEARTSDVAADKRTSPVTARDIDFKHLWRRLRAEGWSAKRPTGLANVWTYTTPGGGHHLVGEDAVVEYVLSSAQTENGEADDEADDVAPGDEFDSVPDTSRATTGVSPHDADGTLFDQADVRASQIDTTTQLSQRTLDAVFEPESADLYQAAVPRAFGLSESDLERNEREAAAGLHLLSEASADESDEEPQQRPQTTRAILTSAKYDPNYLAEGENSDAYESLSSGGSEDDNVEDGDDDPQPADLVSDDDFAPNDEIVALMDDAFISSLRIGDSGLDNQEIKKREEALRGTQWSAASSTFEDDMSVTAYPGMNADVQARPVVGLRRLSHSPLETFFYFMPKSLWVMICEETNRYNLQQIPRRAVDVRAKQSDQRKETLKQIRRRLKRKPAYEPQEILHVIGLLIGRMLCPQKRSFSAHWAMTDDAVVPAGNIGRFMARNRCQDILRDLHFVDNEADHARDKIWKLRPVVDKMQQRFLSGWTLPAVFSFDEGVLPATSKRNTTRMFMPDKPRRYGSKMFMTCDLHMTNRLGYDPKVKEKRQTRPMSIPRGQFTFSRSLAVPSMLAFHWWDRKPVHFLCTGSVMAKSEITRHVKRLGRISVPCPAPVTDYQRWMGGVNVHDQLRLQTYSLQTSTRFRKYYKSLFLGFVDLALVNAYITHKEAARLDGANPMKRGAWFGVLMHQLLQLKDVDFTGVVETPPPEQRKRKRPSLALSHKLEQSEDWVTVSGIQKRRQRSCKVCALLREDPKKKSFATTFFCEKCSVDDAKCWLCNKSRREYKGVLKTCFDIWHEDFSCGQSVPSHLGKRFVLRRPGQKTGAHKATRRDRQLRARRELQLVDGDIDEELKNDEPSDSGDFM